MPVTAAGCRIEPPVSVPIASGASNPATAALDPPDEPPGIRVRSHGLRVTPYAEFSVDEPIANSSMLVLPTMTMPASRSLRTTVASYGGRQPSRIFEPHVVGTPCIASTSFNASGTPASGPRVAPAARRASTAAAAASAPSASTYKNACRRESTAPIRSRCAWVTSTADAVPDAMVAAVWAAVSPVSSVTALLLVQHARHSEPLILGRRRTAQRSLGRKRWLHGVVPKNVCEGHRVRRRRHVGAGNLAHPRDRVDDDVELARHRLKLGLAQGKARQPRQVGDFGRRDRRHDGHLRRSPLAVPVALIRGLRRRRSTTVDPCAPAGRVSATGWRHTSSGVSSRCTGPCS